MRNLQMELKNAQEKLHAAIFNGTGTREEIKQLSAEVIELKDIIENVEDKKYAQEVNEEFNNDNSVDEDDAQYIAEINNMF